MKILHRYVLKEHVGPLAFALSALTSLLFLNQIAKRFGDLAGKGLPWSVIGEFFGLAIPFIIAMTMPMAVLVGTLYAFSRLASENEITALKASGVGMRRIIAPVLLAAAGVTLAMLLFNDQVMPRSNHRLAVLQRDIAQKKPTLALREQVINEITPGRFYLRAGHLEKNSNRMREITIYDFADPARKRTIYADSGDIAMSENQADLLLTLYDGTLQDVPTERPGELQRLSFQTDFIRVRGVGNEFSKTEAEAYKGEREMTLCEMAEAQRNAQALYAEAATEFRATMQQARLAGVEPSLEAQGVRLVDADGRSFGDVYCAAVTTVGGGIQRAIAALRGSPVTPRHADARTPQGGETTAGADRKARPPSPDAAPVVPGMALAQASAATAASPADVDSLEQLQSVVRSSVLPQIEDARIRMATSRRQMDLFGVEIHKKAALAVACFVFVLLGAPIAVRFPRGGVGLVIGVSIVVFGLYYVALIGGQSLGARSVVPPALAMWGANILFGGVGIILLARIGRETATTRGGDAGEMIETVRIWGAKQLARVGVRMERRRRWRR